MNITPYNLGLIGDVAFGGKGLSKGGEQ